MMELVKPPRGVFLDFPLGHPCGKPHNEQLQRQILKDTLNYLVQAKTPGEMVDLPYEWDEDFSWETYERDLESMIREEGGESKGWVPKP
jgi:D-proline reductase (dithiol) PrdB